VKKHQVLPEPDAKRGHLARDDLYQGALKTDISVSHCEIKTIMTTTQNFHEATAANLAEAHDITPRRVRQYVEEGALPRLARGTFDAGWFAHLRTGEKVASNFQKRPSARDLVALGWLSAVGKEPTDLDLEAFGDLFERNGLTRMAAMMALGAAQARRA
jgi:hypothetical protein